MIDLKQREYKVINTKKMIQANELRVGNWIKCKGDIVVLSSIGEVNMVFSRSPFNTLLGHKLEECEPIPITTETLDECGFNCTSKGFWQHPDWYNISLKYRGATYDLRCNFMDRIATNIDYLHQLQNLHFVLVGKELIYNKP